jgi:tetratricopeptide (TPR) repeat protein
VKRPSKLLKRIRGTTDPQQRVAEYEAKLARVRRDDDPIKWAEIQGALAVSQTEAAGDQVGPEEFNAAVEHYLAALSVYTRAEHPEQWATTLCNSANAHLRAANAAPDDSQFHVESAIDDLAAATTIPPDAAPVVWVNAHVDLAAALRTAARWRGPSALMQSAEAYEQVLGAFNRQANPEYWAALNAQYAEVLLASGDLSRMGDAIEASERALEVITRKRDPIWWAHLQLQLGVLHRVCPDGDRSDHLERATAAVDAALSVFKQERHPVPSVVSRDTDPARSVALDTTTRERLGVTGWRTAHLESLRIAVASTSRDDDPERWATLHVAMARELLELFGRTEGDHQEYIEDAISALEAALDVLSADDSARIWVVANRCLGAALLDREAGDPDHNADRGIAALEEAQRRDDPPFDLDEWTVTQAQLGLAYAQRGRGDRAANTAKAVEMFHAAMAIPFKARPWQGWPPAQAWLTSLSMHDGEIPREAPNNPHITTDPVEKRFAPLIAMRDCQPSLELDPHWHVPVELQVHASELQVKLREFVASGRLPRRNRKERANIEHERHSLAMKMVSHLEERRAARLRTEALFIDAQSAGRPFVLFLRGYNMRIVARYSVGVVMQGTLGLEMPELADLVDSIAPMPVVWMANPIESFVVDITIGKRKAYQVGFRVESDVNWEEDVRALMSAASFIVVDNAASLDVGNQKRVSQAATINDLFTFGEDRRLVMSPGVVAEIERLADLRRLEDTFFKDVDAANQLTGRSDCRALADEARNTMRAHETPRSPPEPLPPAMCPWVGGSERVTMERKRVAVAELLERLEAAQRPVLTDVVLDVIYWLLSYAVLLEHPEQLPGLLDRLPSARRRFRTRWRAGR